MSSVGALVVVRGSAHGPHVPRTKLLRKILSLIDLKYEAPFRSYRDVNRVPFQLGKVGTLGEHRRWSQTNRGEPNGPHLVFRTAKRQQYRALQGSLASWG